MKGKKLKTVGLSPKVPGAGVGSGLAIAIVAIALEAFDTRLDVNTVQTIILAVGGLAGAAVGAWKARPGPVVAEPARRAARRSEAGYAGIHPVVVILLAIIVFLILWSVTGSLLIALVALLILLLLL